MARVWPVARVRTEPLRLVRVAGPVGLAWPDLVRVVGLVVPAWPDPFRAVGPVDLVWPARSRVAGRVVQAVGPAVPVLLKAYPVVRARLDPGRWAPLR
ncbi:MAG: hypothetical protein ABW046_07250 [Actinoplanes sp.]